MYATSTVLSLCMWGSGDRPCLTTRIAQQHPFYLGYYATSWDIRVSKKILLVFRYINRPPYQFSSVGSVSLQISTVKSLR